MHCIAHETLETPPWSKQKMLSFQMTYADILVSCLMEFFELYAPTRKIELPTELEELTKAVKKSPKIQEWIAKRPESAF